MTAQDGYHNYGGDKPVKVRLEFGDFAALVKGEVVHTEDLLSHQKVEILLADIGYNAILKCFMEGIEAMRPQRRPEHEFPYWCDCGEKYKTIEEFIECRKNHFKPTPTKPS